MIVFVHQQLTILVVDDDPLTRKLMKRMLERLKHNVVLAENGLIALNLIRDAWNARDEWRYHLCFLDNQVRLQYAAGCANLLTSNFDLTDAGNEW